MRCDNEKSVLLCINLYLKIVLVAPICRAVWWEQSSAYHFTKINATVRCWHTHTHIRKCIYSWIYVYLYICRSCISANHQRLPLKRYVYLHTHSKYMRVCMCAWKVQRCQNHSLCITFTRCCTSTVITFTLLARFIPLQSLCCYLCAVIMCADRRRVRGASISFWLFVLHFAAIL